MLEVWPAILVAGVTFAVPQLLVSNFHGPWVVNVVASVVSMICLIGFLLVWLPRRSGSSKARKSRAAALARGEVSRPTAARKSPRPGFLGSFLASSFLCGHADRKMWMNTPEKVIPSMATMSPKPSEITNPQFKSRCFTTWWSACSLLFKSRPKSRQFTIELAERDRNRHFARGHPLRLHHGQGMGKIFTVFLHTLSRCASRCSRSRPCWESACLHATPAWTQRWGCLCAYRAPLSFFGTLLGWMGVAVTGSDTSSNVLFGSLQKITAQQIGVLPC